MIPNREDIAWVAGFYVGDGSCRGFVRKNSRRYALSITNTDIKALDKVVDIVGFGKVYGPYHTKTKPYYQYRISSFERVQAFLAMIFPRLTREKQEQACDCLDREYYYEYD